MRKTIVMVVMVVLVTMLLCANLAFAGTVPGVEIKGYKVLQEDVKEEDGRVYVNIECFNRLDGVFAINSFTSLRGDVALGGETSVAGLNAQRNGLSALLVVNKIDATAYMVVYTNPALPVRVGPVEVIIDQGMVYVDAQVVAVNIGASWDQTARTVTIAE